MFFRFALALASLLSLSVSKIIYAGVNESGGEFGTGILPGTFGVDYQYVRMGLTQSSSRGSLAVWLTIQVHQ